MNEDKLVSEVLGATDPHQFIDNQKAFTQNGSKEIASHGIAEISKILLDKDVIYMSEFFNTVWVKPKLHHRIRLY